MYESKQQADNRSLDYHSETIAANGMISKQSAIPRAYSNLSLNLESVQKCVDELETRLGVVLSTEPQPGATTAETRDVTCSLAQSIQDDAERLGYVANRLQSILRRIEL